MSFFSSVIIGMLEKELAASEPAVAQYILQAAGIIGEDLMNYVNGKFVNAVAPVAASVQTPQSVE
jgi:hypothetical protein